MTAAAQLPERSAGQRRHALAGANAVRAKRAAFKAELRAGRASLAVALAAPPAYLAGAKVAELLRALPGYGPVRVGRLLDSCRVNPTTTVAGLKPRQRQGLRAALEG